MPAQPSDQPRCLRCRVLIKELPPGWILIPVNLPSGVTNPVWWHLHERKMPDGVSTVMQCFKHKNPKRFQPRDPDTGEPVGKPVHLECRAWAAPPEAVAEGEEYAQAIDAESRLKPDWMQ